MSIPMIHSKRWGQPVELALEQTAIWEIGPLKLAVCRWPREWQLAYRRSDPFAQDYTNWNLNVAGEEINVDEYDGTERFVFAQAESPVQLAPALADRPFVTRPILPMFVPPGEETTIYLSSPLWVCIQVGDPPKEIRETPVYRPSDTWFGPSTMEGELCYASRTLGRLNYENMPMYAHRAFTQVVIRNRAHNPLSVERFSLPVPYLSLFEADNGLLWTEAVTLEHSRDTEMAAMHLEKEPPALAANARPVAQPRQIPGHNLMVRAFGSLFRS